MTDKPQSASGYSPQWVEDARAACLYVATVLGDLLAEDLVVVGGLVPGMLIAQDPPAEGVPLHAGTMDLDLGLSLGVLDDARYSEIARRLRQAGFEDREMVAMEGDTVMGEWAARDIPVCGPGAFVILKALAFRSRGEPKDAYDLYYTVRNFEGGIEDIAGRIGKLTSHPETVRALAILRDDFAEPNHAGPIRAARFSGEGDADVVRQDVAGFVGELLIILERSAEEAEGS